MKAAWTSPAASSTKPPSARGRHQIPDLQGGDPRSKHSPAYWDTSKEPTPSQYELFKKHDSFWKGEFENLKKHCDQAGIAFMSTPFDVESAKFLNDMMDVFKISSSDLTNRPFIEFMCDFKKPIIMSTGAASLAEIAEAVSWIEAKGNPLALLHCVLNYPTMDENAALGMIPALVRHFPQHVIGYSDHTLPNDMKVLEVAALLGAQILEKHFSHDKTLPGNDHYHAMDYKDLQLFRQNFERTLSMIGEMRIEALASEEPPARTPAAPSSPTATSPPGRSSTRTTSRGSVPQAASARHYYEVLGMAARRRHRGRYRPPVGASGIRNACAGRGWRRSPFLRPIRCGSPLSPEFRMEEGNGERPPQ